MDEAKGLKNIPWFLNPRFDIILLIGFPVALILPLNGYFYTHMPRFSFYEYSAFNFPHVISGLSIIYLFQKEECKRHPAIFLIIPCAIFIVTIILYYLGHSRGISIIRFYWGAWHIFIQSLYILGFYKLISHDSSGIDKITDSLVLIALMIFLFFFFSSFLAHAAGWTALTYLLGHFQKWAVFLILFIVTAFIARQVYLYLRWKKVYFFKILYMTMLLVVYAVPFKLFKNILFTYWIVINLHNIQYVAWVWFYYQKKFRGQIVDRARLISYLARPPKVVLYFFALMVASALFNFGGEYVLGVKALKGIKNALAYVHFFLDGRIWALPGIRSVIYPTAD